tara:strand:- start:281 stop:1126 length:846 start_codon:yes stop_codon:yes gene_type:complete
VGGKSILSQFLEPYRKMYQRGGLVDTGTQVSPPMEQPSDTTNTYGGGTMPGMDFTFGGGDFVNPNVGGGLEWTQENFDAGAASSGGSRDFTTSPYGPQGATTWQEVYGSQWGNDNNPGNLDYNDPSTWPVNWSPGMPIPGWQDWYTGGQDSTGQSFVGPGGTDFSSTPSQFPQSNATIFPDYGESGPSIFGNPLDFWSGLVDDPAQDDPVQDTLSYMGVSGGPGGAQGPLGMETAPGYMPGKFIGRKVRRAPALGMGVQDTEQRQDSRSDIIDAVLNELRI